MNLPDGIRPYLRTQMVELVALSNEHPSDEGERTSPKTGGTFEQRLMHVCNTLELLSCWLRGAEAYAAEQKREYGAPSPDFAKYDLVQSLEVLYRSAAANPSNPYMDSVTEEAKGELVDFIEAVFQALGLTESRSAIYSLWQRSRRS